MPNAKIILSSILALTLVFASAQQQAVKRTGLSVDFYGDTLVLGSFQSLQPFTILSVDAVNNFYEEVNYSASFKAIIQTLTAYKEKHLLNDWFYYQLVRTAVELVSPKAENYYRYTLVKWYLMMQSGYGTTVSISGNKLLLYIQSDEPVIEVPYHFLNSKQYVCLNYHDYGAIDFEKEKFTSINVPQGSEAKPFSYKVTRLPNFNLSNYQVKELKFDFYQQEYNFKILLNRQVQKIFANYPVVDYADYFNIPLSKTTYNSLIPLLRENVKKMNQKNGVDYLMRFARYAFAFETDTKVFGKEKRLSPEQTLLHDYSDCEDRAAFFFFLVKEIYNLPMIALAYPEHITIAVKFNKPIGNPIIYKGSPYWVCEATPQKQDLKVGQGIPALQNTAYSVVYEYKP